MAEREVWVMSVLVNISDVCSEIFAGGDAPKSNMSEIMGYPINIKGGIMEKECSEIITNYFEKLRK